MKKVAIIGGGIVGLSSAYYLSQAGFEVTVISDDDKKEGCSYGNAGMIVPSHFIPLAAPGIISQGLRWMLRSDSPFYIKPRFDKNLVSWGWKFYKAATAANVQKAMPLLKALNTSSRELYVQLAEEEGLNFSLCTKGLFTLCKTRHALQEEAQIAVKAKQMGMKAEILTPKELMAMDPGVEFDVEGGVYWPLDAFMVPGRFMAEMQNLLSGRGVKFAAGQIKSITVKGSKIAGLNTDSATVVADEYIVAAGAWSSGLLRNLKVNIPLQGGKGYSVEVNTPPVKPEICSLLAEARVSVTPMDGAVRFGGTMELNGTDRSINLNRVGGIFKSIPGYYPQFKDTDFTASKVWVGLRPCSPDGLPYIGRFKHYDNLIAATGHSMMGMSLGPITGKLVSQVVSGKKTEVDISLLNPDRYL
ncbi:D-amino acid dehydrogenase small subunit [Fulvivirga imtechensis AK7]|uniref:D-amino acid dehydrogenase small subunit n=1 Tax=Fulvivirga imtechensis AK7 TaxID=1237149 RepID=L8JL84_9BACT|nr:FAD-dependent oxidoreductase [Fulvivirga imtechensis]ELR68998.1 D-amino acid dehydrogenase small subunit [Fulvivirga imtechensis AK7]